MLSVLLCSNYSSALTVSSFCGFFIHYLSRHNVCTDGLRCGIIELIAVRLHNWVAAFSIKL